MKNIDIFITERLKLTKKSKLETNKWIWLDDERCDMDKVLGIMIGYYEFENWYDIKINDLYKSYDLKLQETLQTIFGVVYDDINYEDITYKTFDKEEINAIIFIINDLEKHNLLYDYEDNLLSILDKL